MKKLLARLVPGVCVLFAMGLAYLYGLYVRGVNDATPRIVIQASDTPAASPAPVPIPSVVALEEAAHIFGTELVQVKQDLAAVLAEVRALRTSPPPVLHVITPTPWQTVVERVPGRRRPAGNQPRRSPHCPCPTKAQ